MQEALQNDGLFETNYLWFDFYFYSYIRYVKMISIQMTMFILAIAGVLYSDSFAVHMLSALLLGFFWQQLAFIGHDLCHNAVTHSRYIDSLLASSLA